MIKQLQDLYDEALKRKLVVREGNTEEVYEECDEECVFIKDWVCTWGEDGYFVDHPRSPYALVNALTVNEVLHFIDEMEAKLRR